MRVWPLVLACGCFVASPVMHFGGGKSGEEAQRDQLTKATPPLLATDGDWQGEVRTVKVRVWADDEYRAQNVRWEATFADELAYANAVLAPMLGIHLEAEYRTWQRHAPGSTLEDDLTALRREDPGADAFAVIGLTSSIALVTGTFDQLGLASLPGQHLMLRGYADVGERQAFDRAFRDLPTEDRQMLYEGRRRHKTTALLLHELGHNLGAPHVDVTDTLMNPMYSGHSAAFDARSHELMLATVDRRLGRLRAAPAATAATVARHPTLVIQLDADGHTRVGGKPIDEASLGELFQLSVADDRDTELVIRAAPSVSQDVIDGVIQRARAAGLVHVSTTPDEP
jgi:biopolymer transport protein ExbD